MGKLTGICINLENKELIKWWNKTGNKLVKTVDMTDIVETATNKKVAVLVTIKGPLSWYVHKQYRKFEPSAVTGVIEREWIS